MPDPTMLPEGKNWSEEGGERGCDHPTRMSKRKNRWVGVEIWGFGGEEGREHNWEGWMPGPEKGKKLKGQPRVNRKQGKNHGEEGLGSQHQKKSRRLAGRSGGGWGDEKGSTSSNEKKIAY